MLLWTRDGRADLCPAPFGRSVDRPVVNLGRTGQFVDPPVVETIALERAGEHLACAGSPEQPARDSVDCTPTCTLANSTPASLVQ